MVLDYIYAITTTFLCIDLSNFIEMYRNVQIKLS